MNKFQQPIFLESNDYNERNCIGIIIKQLVTWVAQVSFGRFTAHEGRA